MTKAKPSITLGGLEVLDKETDVSRMAIFLWGPAGVGKSAFAATAPGDKLWLSMGDNEHATVMGRDDVSFVKLYEQSQEDFWRQAKGGSNYDNPFGLDQYLAEKENIQTVVFDSATALAYRALQKAVADGDGAGRGFTPTLEAPGIAAYGGRNARVLGVLTGLLRVTAKHNVHIIITGHEGEPTMNDDNKTIEYIGVQLGGQLVNNVSWRLSEIWYMSQQRSGKEERQIAIRPTRLRKPMKSRMFDTSGSVKEFILNYNARKPDSAKGQMTIASFYNQWLDNKMQHIPIPV